MSNSAFAPKVLTLDAEAKEALGSAQPSFDSAIIAEYVNLAIPADRIVADPQLAARFRDAVNRRLQATDHVDLITLNRRLLNLCRRGEAKGGLPRLKRISAGRAES